MSALKERNEKVCLNCTAVLYGRYCHVCGQENVQPRRPVWEIPWAFVNNIINVDGRFFLSVRRLLFSPGFLAREFVSGRRVKYHDPVRTYLFSSFLFFLVAAMLFGTMRDAIDSEDRALQAGNAGPVPARYGNIGDESMLQARVSEASATFGPDSLALQPEGAGSLRFNTRGDVKDFLGRYEKDLQYMLWFSLPGFALILKLLYIRRRIFLWDHLVFSLYLYSFNFLLISAGFWFLRLSRWVVPGTAGNMVNDILETLFFLGALVYAFMSVRRFYGQSYAKTTFKFILLSLGVFVLFLLEFVLVFIFEYRHQLFA